MICSISAGSYSLVLTISTRSNKSTGSPCGDLYLVPRILAMPRLLAIMTIGLSSPSRALLRKEKHSISSMCTSSMNRTPGTMLALPSSLHSDTLVFICERSSGLISPVSPANNARKPWVRLLITSISCSDTVWVTSLRFWISPSGHWTKRV